MTRLFMEIDDQLAAELMDDVETPGETVQDKLRTLAEYRASAVRVRERDRLKMASEVFGWAAEQKRRSEQ